MGRIALDVTPLSGRMTAAEFRDAANKGKSSGRRTSKYGAKPVRTEEGYFDSTTEYKRFLTLVVMEKAGIIRDLKRQIPYTLEAGGVHFCKYIADFVYYENDKLVVEDSKGHKTREYLQKKRLMKEILGIEILETGRQTPAKSSRKSR